MDEFWQQMIQSIKAMGSPLRPEPTEVAFFQQKIQEHVTKARQRDRYRALLLGVTPELVGLDWPANTLLDAVDRSDAMISAFWSDDPGGARHLIRGNWWNFPSPSEEYDFILGDGVLNLNAYPSQFQQFSSRMASILKPDGLALFRVFTRNSHESPRGVVIRLREGQFSTYQELRFCFHLALQENVTTGAGTSIPEFHELLAVHGVEQSELEQFPDFEAIAKPMLRFKNPNSLCMFYPSDQEFTEIIAPDFEVVHTGFGSHSLAAHCPIYGLRKKPSG